MENSFEGHPEVLEVIKGKPEEEEQERDEDGGGGHAGTGADDSSKRLALSHTHPHHRPFPSFPSATQSPHRADRDE